MSDNQTSSLIDTKVGRYRIQEHLGTGGMARVFKAQDTNLDRAVAIKILHAHLADDPTFKQRFEREAKFVAGFNHPNIIQVYDFDILKRDGEMIYYMVMPYIPGPSLADTLEDLKERGEVMAHDRALKIMLDLTSALSYAHKQGMVHRDVKPANVLFDEHDNAVLTDFGIAHLAESSRLTQEGITIGTPAYMSPEQATGELVDKRSDLYALGIILYEMLTGQPPFRDEGGISILLQHLNTPVPKVSDVINLAPVALDTVILRALAKAPEDRYQTADEFAEELHGVFTGEISSPVSVSTRQFPAVEPPSESDSAHQPAPSSKRQYVPLGILVTGVAIIGVLLAASLLNRPGPDDVSGQPSSIQSLNSTDEGQVSAADSMTGNLYFESDFTAGESFNDHWPQDENPVFTQRIEDSFYYLSNMRPRTAVTSLFDPAYTYVDETTITMKAELDAESSPASGYGIVFRYQNEDNYNVFAVDGLGRYSIWTREEGTWRELRNAEDEWTRSEVIAPVGESNELIISIRNNTLTGYVNGTPLIEVEDDTFSGGSIGIYLASTSEGNTIMRVDRYGVMGEAPTFAESMTGETDSTAEPDS